MSEPQGRLWIVATPIGTIEDLGVRAREVLRTADLILAEDTRRARGLLAHLGIRGGRRLRSLHEHNEAQRVGEVMAALEGGSSVALMSDAGTPVLSDPGFLVVRAARAARVSVASVPGASAFTAALAAAGLPPLPAALIGFLPAKAGPRRRKLAGLSAWHHTLVILLSPHRLRREMEDLAEVLGRERPAVLLAELSKLHERALAGSLGEIAASQEVEGPRGEYVVVVGPSATADGAAEDDETTVAAVRAAYREAVAAGSDRRAAIKEVAAALGLTRRRVFDSLKNSE